MRAFLSRAIPVMIPFFAFALGAGLDLTKVWQAGLLGLAMGVAVVVLTGIPCSWPIVSPAETASRVSPLHRRPGTRRPSPPSSPRANPAYADAAGPATILVAACVVVTAILVPVATAWTAKVVGAREDEPEEPLADAVQAERA